MHWVKVFHGSVSDWLKIFEALCWTCTSGPKLPTLVRLMWPGNHNPVGLTLNALHHCLSLHSLHLCNIINKTLSLKCTATIWPKQLCNRCTVHWGVVFFRKCYCLLFIIMSGLRWWCSYRNGASVFAYFALLMFIIDTCKYILCVEQASVNTRQHARLIIFIHYYYLFI